jgi:predicted naringenin-chalcone synthase
MYLSKHLVKAIKENIESVVNGFLIDSRAETDYWAIHPGGVRIVEAVKESLQLNDSHVEDSMHVLKHYGNMSSPTILFILHRILHKIRSEKQSKSIFACAFGPGVTVELIQLSSISTSHLNSHKHTVSNYAIPV